MHCRRRWICNKGALMTVPADALKGMNQPLSLRLCCSCVLSGEFPFESVVVIMRLSFAIPKT